MASFTSAPDIFLKSLKNQGFQGSKIYCTRFLHEFPTKKQFALNKSKTRLYSIMSATGFCVYYFFVNLCDNNNMVLTNS